MGTVQIYTLARSTGLAFAMITLAGGLSASAQMNSNQRFEARGLVIAWAADANGSAPIVSDFVVDTGTGTSAAGSGDIDLISTDVHTVVTGSLNPVAGENNAAPLRVTNIPGGRINLDSQPNGVLDADDTFNSFQLRAGSDTNTNRAEIFSSFYVASNTGFSIDAEAVPVGATTPDAFSRIRLQLRVTESGNDGLAFGSAAQFPHTGNTPAAGTRSNARRLSSMEGNPITVFRGNRRTARINGTIAQQSVRFDARYRYSSGNIDLSDGVIDAEAEVTYTIYVP